MNRRMRVMVVDDEMIIRESFFHWFQKSGYIVDTAESGLKALEKLETNEFDVLFADIRMPKMSGIELLEKVKASYPDTMVVIITAYGSIDTAVKAMKMGASDYLLKPFRPDQLSLLMEKLDQQKELNAQYDVLKRHLNKITRFENIIGQSSPMKKIFDLIPEVAESDASILLRGETGTGKELVAKAIHAKSKRKHNPFIAINCGAIPDPLLESELFGHQKGSFTGAAQTRKGFFEVVSGGTLFLDEIGEVSTRMQIDLLRVLDEKKIVKIGSTTPVDVDFRLISATRQDIEKNIQEDTYREDFFYRINVITIHLPPLRKRKDDIPLLSSHFIEKFSHETNKRVSHIHRDAIRLLTRYDWPGNVRELKNVIERAVVLSKSDKLGVEDFSFLRRDDPTSPLHPSLKENEINYIKKILKEVDGNITHAAKILDINRVTLHKKMKRYNLKKE